VQLVDRTVQLIDRIVQLVDRNGRHGD